MIFKAYLIDKNNIKYELPHTDITVKKYRTLKASELSINIVETDFFPEIGDTLQVFCDLDAIFQGKIFEINQNYSITNLLAYDNLVYLLQSETLISYNKTASEIIELACTNIGITSKNIVNTLHSFTSINYENTPYLEIINELITQTTDISNKNYILFDDFGTITLKEGYEDVFEISINNIIDFTKYSNFSSQNYNYIKVEQKTQGGYYKYYEAFDTESIEKIGKFQKIIRVDRNLTTAQCNELAKNYLAQYSCNQEVFEIKLPFYENINIDDKIYFLNNLYTVIKIELKVSSTQNIITIELGR